MKIYRFLPVKIISSEEFDICAGQTAFNKSVSNMVWTSLFSIVDHRLMIATTKK